MILVCYQPDAPGSQSGEITQFTRGRTVDASLLPWPSIEDLEGPRDYKLFRVADGEIVAKP